MAILDFLPNRDHLRIANARRVDYSPIELAEVGDRLSDLVRAQDPIDHTKPLAHFHFSIDPVEGSDDAVRASLRPLTRHGLGEPLGFTRTGLRQFAAKVLPSRGLGFVDSLVELGEPGRKLAELNVAAFSRQQSDPSMLRTAVLFKERRVRAVASSRYSILDDLDVITTLLDEPETTNLPVLSYRRDDTGSILRLGLVEGATGRGGSEVPTHLRRFPAVEWGNSEVGLGALNLRAGFFEQWCTNGLWGWGSDSFSARWIHAGGASASDRIRQGIRDAMETAAVESSGVLARYETALDTAVDDVHRFLDAALRQDFSRLQIAAIGTKLTDESASTHGNLASAVDAVTLYAQDVSVIDQRGVETAAAKLLAFGLRRARRDGTIRTDRDDDGKAILVA